MNKKTAVVVAGGDLRQIYLAKYLSEFFDVTTCGLFDGDKKPEEISEADYLILPIIVTSDGATLNAPFSEGAIKLSSLWKLVKSGGTVLGGKLSPELTAEISSYGVIPSEYFSREELVIKNCIPTAEGALQIAMEELPVTIHGLDVLVLGYGRVGKATAKLFSAAGARVTASARKYSDLAWCESEGITPVMTEKVLGKLGGYDLIINTIPARIMGKDVLSSVSEDCLIIDLASKPGGVDFEYAGELGLKVIWALSLPTEVRGAKPQKTKPSEVRQPCK